MSFLTKKNAAFYWVFYVQYPFERYKTIPTMIHLDYLLLYIKSMRRVSYKESSQFVITLTRELRIERCALCRDARRAIPMRQHRDSRVVPDISLSVCSSAINAEHLNED